jgi:hypothetical protein
MPRILDAYPNVKSWCELCRPLHVRAESCTQIPIMVTQNGQSRLIHVRSIIRSWVAGILSSRYEYRYNCTIQFLWLGKGVDLKIDASKQNILKDSRNKCWRIALILIDTKVPTHFNRTQLIHTMYLHFSFSQYKQISFLNYTAFKMQVQHFVKHTRRTKTGFWIAFAATTTFFNSTHFTIQRTTVFCNVLILLILCNFNKHKRVRRHRNMEERLKYNLICFFSHFHILIEWCFFH